MQGNVIVHWSNVYVATTCNKIFGPLLLEKLHLNSVCFSRYTAERSLKRHARFWCSSWVQCTPARHLSKYPEGKMERNLCSSSYSSNYVIVLQKSCSLIYVQRCLSWVVVLIELIIGNIRVSPISIDCIRLCLETHLTLCKISSAGALSSKYYKMLKTLARLLAISTLTKLSVANKY